MDSTVAPFVFRPEIATLMAFSALISLFLPVVAAVWFHRRTGAPPRSLGLGALTFFVSQPVLRLTWQIPLAIWVQKHHADDATIQYAFLFFSSLTAGIFEETARYVVYRKLLKEHTWRAGVMFGLGHGGLEAILLVGLNAVAMAVLYALLGLGVDLKMPAEQAAPVLEHFRTLTALTAVAGGLERVFALIGHVFFSLLVLRAVNRGALKWLFAAIGAHLLFNLVAVVTMKLAGVAAAEAVIAVYAIAAFLFIRRERTLAPAPPGQPPTASAA